MAQRKVALACSVCGSRNYTVPASPNRKIRLEVNKYCKYCGRHTLHRETK
ncbi:50S ribosomal protein L33 [Secundilactobacillus similis]|nr:50S ribosomal protein L33 [Secundilactobacillus similis]